MASEQLQAEGINAVATPPEDAKPSTWAAKWDMWWMLVLASGWTLIILHELIALERYLSRSSFELKFEIAAPAIIGAVAAFEIWKAHREKRIEKGLSLSVLNSILFILWFTYMGMTELRHFLG